MLQTEVVEEVKMHVIFKNSFLKIISFMRQCEKMP